MITIVSPYYGPQTTGGAETQARSLARALHAIGEPVRVWASTARDSFHPDETDCYPAGMGEVDDIPIWRFVPTPADERGVPLFFGHHPDLLPPLERFTIHELRLLGSLLSSDQLYEAILAQHEPSNRFIFIPYAFPTTFWGALLAPRQSFLLPCLHDEPYARYRTYRYLFSRVGGILCNSHPEAALVQRLYQVENERVHVPGEGIDLTPCGDGLAFREQLSLSHQAEQAGRPVTSPHPSHPALLLYVGRRDESKNFPLLLAYVREYWARRGLPLCLLVAGRNPIDFPPALRSFVLDLGYLDEAAKHDAYAAADIFIQPSRYESFSIVLMESWLQHTPALVHSACAVTSDHCQRSGGGLAFGSFGTFAAALDLLLPRPDLRRTLGARGHAYVLETCNWHEVARRTAAAVQGD
jgi:glycosyltransferase involved in cell wall biosynthesis